MTPIYKYLETGELPLKSSEARSLRMKSAQYAAKAGVLYKKGYLQPWLRCVGPRQAEYVLQEIHLGSCGSHAGPRALVRKAVRLGYYSPTMYRDAKKITKQCHQLRFNRNLMLILPGLGHRLESSFLSFFPVQYLFLLVFLVALCPTVAKEEEDELLGRAPQSQLDYRRTSLPQLQDFPDCLPGFASQLLKLPLLYYNQTIKPPVILIQSRSDLGRKQSVPIPLPIVRDLNSPLFRKLFLCFSDLIHCGSTVQGQASYLCNKDLTCFQRESPLVLKNTNNYNN